MSRKEPKAQNDISIIIGNLPKRLQLKIAEDAQQLHNSIEDGDCAPLQVEARRQWVDTNTVVTNPAEPSSISNDDASVSSAAAAIIPGLLRIKANAEEQKPNRSPVTRVKTQRQDVLSLPLQLPKSPVHHQGSRSHIAQPPWFKAIDVKYADQLSQLHEKLVIMLQTNAVLQYWDTFCAVHKQLQQIFTQLLLQNLKFCCEQKIDTFFWKLLFYNVRENLKKQNAVATPKRMLWLLDDGLDFYADLHIQLCEKYLRAINSQPHTHDSENCQNAAHKFEFIAKVAAQKLLICLGDLNRYKSKQMSTNDYTEAFMYYQKAQRLIPTNGIPYNQLAIVSIQERKKFDAIYYHMRSLMSSNAINSAKESLLGLFDEIRKKYEETEMKASPIHQNNSNSKSRNRTEVWVYPDGVRRLHRNNLNSKQIILPEENRLNEMPTEDLLRRFISLYLYIIGKLYTGIGMETIQAQQQKLLTQFNALLKRDPLVISRSRMLKILALNVFVLHENIHKDFRREIRYQTFNFCNQILGLILRECNRLFSNYLDTENTINKQNFDDLNTLLQYIRSYCNFLAKNVHIWEPLRCEEHAVIDCWTELKNLFQFIRKIPTERGRKEQQLITEEEIFLAGFSPMTFTTTAVCKRCKSFMESSSDADQFKERIVQIADFEKVYTDNCMLLEIPEEAFVLEEWHKTVQTALENLESDENYENIAINSNKANSKALPKTNTPTLVLNSVDTQISHLNKLKKQLEAKTNVKKMYNAKLEEILSYVNTKIYIEVRPKYLLLDTNCLIDCLEDFEQIVQQYKCYTLIIPFTVVKELDGLSKGVKMESYEKSIQKHRIHHFDDVSSRAKKSLDFIKVAKNNVKCATTKGSIINASLFSLVEEEYVSNDDKILATALALSKTMSISNETNGKCVIQTELVLITTDRNLRVKALSRNLAVSELCEFMQWAKNCNA